MKRVKNYLKLIRVKHYLKNVLIFLPLIFSGHFFDYKYFINTLLGFLSFSFVASIVYIINDYNDIEKDKKHPLKKFRPLASGDVSKTEALILLLVLGLLVCFIDLYFIYPYCNNTIFILFQFLYLLLNIGYSLGLKDIPILDVVILVSGFIIRLLFGGVIDNIFISKWLYLTIMSGSFYMGLGKRRNELLKNSSKARKVLEKYNKSFLDKFMNIFMGLIVVYYSFWCIDVITIKRLGDKALYTVPLLLVILMKYSYNIEEDSSGDPVDVIVNDKILLLLCFIFGLIMMFLLYFRGVLL